MRSWEAEGSCRSETDVQTLTTPFSLYSVPLPFFTSQSLVSASLCSLEML